MSQHVETSGPSGCLQTLPEHWKLHRWRALFPIVACLASPLLGSQLGHRLYALRFRARRTHYESVAAACDPQRMPCTPRTRPSDTGRSRTKTGDAVVAVDFLVVTLGFAGHMGYMRVYDTELERRVQKGEEKLPHAWRWTRPLTRGWYVVTD